MKISRKMLASLITLAILSLIASYFVYLTLPETIPTHYGIDGNVDAYGGRDTIFVFAALPFIVAIIMPLSSRIDPRRKNYAQFSKTFHILMAVLFFYMLAFQWLFIAGIIGLLENPMQYIMVLIAVLFIIIGNYLPKVKHNYLIGVRTPWTIANKISWQKTHRLTGYLFVGAGLISLLLTMINQQIATYFIIVTAMLISLIALGYSYLVYRREDNHAD